MPWFEIYVEDMKRARKFYEGLLGVELNLEDMPGGEMEMCLFPGKMSLPRAAVALIEHPMRKPNEQGHCFIFLCPTVRQQLNGPQRQVFRSLLKNSQ